MNFAMAASVASCLESPPHQEKVKFTCPSELEPPPLLLSALPESLEPVLPPQAAKDTADRTARVSAVARFMLFLITFVSLV